MIAHIFTFRGAAVSNTFLILSELREPSERQEAIVLIAAEK